MTKKQQGGVRTCTKCARALPEAAFSVDRRLKSGRTSWCLECRRVHFRAWSARVSRNDNRAASGFWRETWRDYANRNREKLRARASARYAKKTGALVMTGRCSMDHRGDCRGGIQLHHWRGYEYPLDVIELCHFHNRYLERRPVSEESLRAFGVAL